MSTTPTLDTYVVVDLETTGLVAAADRVIEIAAVRAVLGLWRATCGCLYRVTWATGALYQARCCDRRPAYAGGPDADFTAPTPASLDHLTRMIATGGFTRESDPLLS